MDAAEEHLPYIDQHAVEIAAGVESSWAAVMRTAEALPSRGFRIASEVPGRELGLSGHHPFSRYALVFHLDEVGPGRTRVRAETRATFPHLRGRIYRALVIGTRLHILATRRILGRVKRRAESAPPR
jgi:hypothetical protein